mgnify:CR=1 FL=1
MAELFSVAFEAVSRRTLGRPSYSFSFFLPHILFIVVRNKSTNMLPNPFCTVLRIHGLHVSIAIHSYDYVAAF